MKFDIIQPSPDDTVAVAAADRIRARVDELAAERERRTLEQEQIATRLRQIERDLAECMAAAKFFKVLVIEPDEGEREHLVQRIAHYRARAAASEPHSSMWAMFSRRAAEYVERLSHLDAVEAKRDAVQDGSSRTSAISKVLSPPAQDRAPKVRDLVLDQLKAAGDQGSKAAPIHKWIEATYGMTLHSKTVGMTLYRLSQEGLVHRKKQVWFIASQAEQSLPVNAENPGAGAPGQSQLAE